MNDQSLTDNQQAFVQSVVKRIETLLPIRTGRTIREVEIDPQFIHTKELFLKNECHKPRFITLILTSLTGLLKTINAEAQNNKLKYRDEKSRWSTLLVCKLLTDVLTANWNRKSFYMRDIDAISNYSNYYYYDVPEPLDSNIIVNILDFYINLMSSGMLREVLTLIRNEPLPSQRMTLQQAVEEEEENFKGGEQQTSEEGSIISAVSEVDSCIEIILAFVSTANPDEYYQYLVSKVFCYSNKGQTIPLPVIQTYVPLLKYLYFSRSIIDKIASDSLKAIAFIKSNTWKQVFLFFLVSSGKDQMFSRPEDYKRLLDSQTMRHYNDLKLLFDETLTLFEESQIMSRCAPFVLACLLCACLDDFNEMNSVKPINKLKLTFNKRLRYVSQILKDSASSLNLECFEVLIHFFHLGARLEASGFKHHPVLLFSLRHIDETYGRLRKFEEVHKKELLESDALKLKYETVRVNYYTAAILLQPDKYVDIVIDIYKAEMQDIRITRVFVKIMKGLSEIEIAQGVFLKVISGLVDTLKSIMYGALKILHCYAIFCEQENIHHQNLKSNELDAFYVDENVEKDDRCLKKAFEKTQTCLDHYAIDLEDRIRSHGLMHDITKQMTTMTATTTTTTTATAATTATTTSTASPVSLSSFYDFRIISNAEEILANIFAIFVAAPDLYFNDKKLMNDENLNTVPYAQLLRSLVNFNHMCVLPLREAFKAQWIAQGNTRLFDAARKLSMQMLEPNSKIDLECTVLSSFTNFHICNCIISSICETCLGLSLTDPKFKSSFLFLIDFLHKRDNYTKRLLSNSILLDKNSRKLYDTCGGVIYAVEKVLLLSSCTHDAQFYNYAKQGIEWYVDEMHNHSALYSESEICDNLLETFEQMNKKENVFTGFVSLQKKHCSIFRGAKPTKALFHVWLIILQLWREMLVDNKQMNENNMIFRHFLGFLVSASGCFTHGVQSSASKQKELQESCSVCISEFFDQCISLLTSQDLVVRAIVKETLSNESHSDVYDMIASKLTAKATSFLERKLQTVEIVVFLEQAMTIMTAMLNVRNDGTLLLSSLLPQICQFFIHFINSVDDLSEKLRLKLRFCKLAIALESDRNSTGLNGAYKLRNFYAKATMEWLEQGVVYEDFTDTETGKGKQTEVCILKMDFAVQCSKALRYQLENLFLEIPDGIKDDDTKKYKDLAFGNYFSIFYKIIQKYTTVPELSRNKHTLQQVVDNILATITNILQYDSEIGIQYLLPMGYHENQKIRAIFLNVFASMLSSQIVKKKREEFSIDLVDELSKQTEIFSSVADCATSMEHNLLASSLFSVFSYTKRLDKLLQVLLIDEIASLTRSTDLFRRNSTLTRLLFNFTQDFGLPYLNRTLGSVIQEIVFLNIHFEVEKKESSEDSALFFEYVGKLVESITKSADDLPVSFKFVCAQIYQAVRVKFEDAALIAVGSFIFLRCLCPAIISPEQYLKIPVENMKTKRSLMQLVKVLQNMANGTLSSIRWPGLVGKLDVLNELNDKIVAFLKSISTVPTEDYPFPNVCEKKPLAELRYLHKFIYNNFVPIRTTFLRDKVAVSIKSSHERVEKFKEFDRVVMKMGQPKPSVKLQLNSALRMYEVNGNDEEEIKFNDFMTKMSLKYADTPPDAVDLIHSAIFKDATPAIVVNLKKMKKRPKDIQYLVYKLMETASQVWDNKFYLIYDFSEFYFYNKEGPSEFTHLVSNYSSKQLFSNCKRIYYFNIPRPEHSGITESIKQLRKKGAEYGTRIYIHSSVDSDHIVGNLCLDQETVTISKDCKSTYKNVFLYESSTKRYVPVYLKIGRIFLTLFFQERVSFRSPLSSMDNFNPVEVYRLSDISRCEISNYTGFDDEFTIYLNQPSEVTLRSPDRLEILRFLYFTTSRLPKDLTYQEPDKDYQNEVHEMHWFARLYNIVFQGLLSHNSEVKTSSAVLFGALSSYYDIDFGITEKHARTSPFPTDATNLVVAVSNHLASHYPRMTYRFFKAYFDNYENMESQSQLSSILYMAPWVNNVYDYVYSQSGHNGLERVADLIRQFCRITSLNRKQIPFINDYIWKKLFQETRLVSSLVEEVVAFAIDSKNEGPEWSFIIAVIVPSVEVCGEVMSRLMFSVRHAVTTDSAIASQSKLFEITVLVKICSSLFFNSYILARLFLADIIFFVTLFIDNTSLEVGSDLRNLIISTVQSFLHKPRLTVRQQDNINQTIEYFSTPRAKMLFGMTRDVKSILDVGQSFNRIANFEVLCDYLDEFIDVVSSSDDKTNWKARWSSNAFDVAFDKYSLFQNRAVLVAGILAKSGLTDSIACRAIKLIAHGKLRSIETVMCTSIATARIVNGLQDTSMLPPILIWPQFCFALMNCSILYQAGVQNIIASVTKMIGSGSDHFIDKSYEKRKYLEPYLSDFEKRHEITVTKENFGAYVFMILTQGLKVSQFRHLAIESIKTYYRKRFHAEIHKSITTKCITANAYLYLVFLYLYTDNSEFEEFLEEFNIESEFVQISKCQRISKFLIDFMLQDDDTSRLTLVYLGQFFSDVKGVDIGLRTRFIAIYHELLVRHMDTALLIYHMVQPALTLWLVNTGSLEDIEKVSEIILMISEVKDYNPRKYVAIIDELLTTNKLQIIKRLRDMEPVESVLNADGRFTPSFNIDIKDIQVMFYRSACIYVEGLKLED
ncbi:IRA2 [Candida oxycetoniae]|uniref:IRA2 n=1 Tax=Candida oxycetoniae TaxID=497107 RepID=A0AAI9STL5_9ASCO|nr:IRA2 [Candida oxycetoniae]KAI3402447.2 IRA2 [Candida oxycetoniae]